MQVYKFGGASIATPERMKALLPIIQEAKGALTVVVSAMGKTTNALEEIVKAACTDKAKAHTLAHTMEQQHLDYARAVLSDGGFTKATKVLAPLFTELQWAVDDASASRYDYSYDQIVCIGELLSTRLFALFLEEAGVANEWVDIRQIIRTDDTWRDGRVDTSYTTAMAREILQFVMDRGLRVITQGFIGAT